MSGMLHGDLQIVPRMSDLAAILARRRKAQQEAEDNDEGFYSREDEPPARKEPASSLPRVKKPEPAPSKGGESSVPSGAARREDLAKPILTSALRMTRARKILQYYWENEASATPSTIRFTQQ